MKRRAQIVLASVLVLCGIMLVSMTPDEGKKKVTMAAPYLGLSNYSGGTITKPLFDSLLKQGVTARDSSGSNYKVVEFTFGYGERNLYEDSTGKLVILTDYVSEICAGDTLSAAFKNYVFRDNRTKAGDTAYFDNIKVQTPGGIMTTKNMRFILTK